MELIDFTSIVTGIGVLTVLTNLIVEVIKKVIPVHPNIIAVVVALLLTVGSFFAVSDIYGINVTWYYVVASVVVGFMVAYAAMFGFDKLKEVLMKVKVSK